MGEKIKTALLAIWRFPCKSALLLLIIIGRWEGDLPKTDALPWQYVALLLVAFALLFFDRGFPIKVCVGLVILSSIARENYPFSHFPMYDRFTDHTFYVFVKDKDGQPIAVETLTSTRTSRLKKPYDKQLDKIRRKLDKRKRELSVEDRRAAGEETLAALYNNSNAEAKARLEALAPISLYHVNVFMRDGEIDERAAEKIAELELPPK